MKRTIALAAAWTASAAAAVGLGFLAVSLVGASASSGTGPAAATSPTSTATPSASTAPTVPSVPSATAQYATTGGTVFADCTSGSPVLAGVPAAGWVVDDSDDPGEMEFEAGDARSEVDVTCVGGAPVFRPDDSSGRDGGGHGPDD